MGWRHIGSHPKAASAGAYSEPFLVEYRRPNGGNVVAVSRAYLTFIDNYAGLQSIQKGLVYNSADPDLAYFYEPISWQPMPSAGITQMEGE